MLVVLVVYVLPLTAIQKIILEPTLPKTWFTFIISIFFVCYLGSFAYNLNGSARLELTPQSLQLYRKIHFFGYGLRVRTADVKQIQTRPWMKIRHQESEPRVLCSLVTKQRSYQLERAVRRAEAEWLAAEVTNFLETSRASGDIT